MTTCKTEIKLIILGCLDSVTLRERKKSSFWQKYCIFLLYNIKVNCFLLCQIFYVVEEIESGGKSNDFVDFVNFFFLCIFYFLCRIEQENFQP